MVSNMTFCRVPDIEDPTERIIQVAKWYISGWHHKVTVS